MERVKTAVEVGDPLLRFYAEHLPCAQTFYRATGYFSPSALSAANEPYASFFNNGGSLKLLIGQEVDSSPRKLDRHVLEEVSSRLESKSLLPGDLSQYPNESLKALLNSGQVVIRIVAPSRGKGLFHSKFGILCLHNKSTLAFNGSANETRPALVGENHESTSLYLDSEGSRAILQDFLLIWRGKDEKWVVSEFVPTITENETLNIHDKVVIDLGLPTGPVDADFIGSNPHLEEQRLRMGLTRSEMAQSYSD